MGFHVAFALVALGWQPRISTPNEALEQAAKVAAKLTTRIERSIAYLTIAQAENKLGDKPSALKALDLGWQAYKTGSDKGMSEGDRTDIQFLFNEGDQATLPEPYAIEYLIAGNKPKALEVADSFGDTPLEQAFRHDIGDKIRKRFPEDYYELAYSESERKKFEVRKQQLLDQVPKAKEEPDPGKSAFLLWQIANSVEVFNARNEAVEILHDALALGPKIEPLPIRVVFMANMADTLWLHELKDEAKSLITETMKLDATLEGDPKQVLLAHLNVEQAKYRMGLPNNFDKIMKEQDKANGVLPVPSPPKIDSNKEPPSPYAFFDRADKLEKSGDIEGAKAVLRNAKIAPDNDGAWHRLTAELQVLLGDMSSARVNLTEASRRLVASTRPVASPGEDPPELERVVALQAKVGDKAGASKTIVACIRKLTDGPDTAKIMHMGDGGDHMVVHDRKSAILHKGAMMLARIGDFEDALAMAKSIPGAGHRAIALAGIVRDYNVQP